LTEIQGDSKLDAVPEAVDTGPRVPTPVLVETERVLLPMPVNIRSLSLATLAILGSVFMLHWAADVLIPLMAGVTCSYALAPLVNRLERMGIARSVGAALTLITLVGSIGWTAYAFSADATQLMESLPDAAQTIRKAMRARRNQPATALDKMQEAATQLEQAAKESNSSTGGAVKGVTRVQIERAQFNLNDYVLSSTPRVFSLIGQTVVLLFITYFLLVSGSSFRRKLVKLAGPTFTQKKITVQALDEITEQIQRYLLVLIFISVIVGVATWLAFWAVGIEHAAVWGILAFVLNFVPYIGSIVVTGGSALVGFVQFGNIDMALLVAGISLTIHTLSGNLLTPWLTSRTSRMNPVIVFVGVLAFGWLWGVWGLLLGMPALLMVKVVCDRVEDFKPIGELLGK
jgi:predicted PurR-regulated permease PerM